MNIYINDFKSDVSLKDYDLSEKACFLDIETTGLNRNKNIIYLVGLLHFNTNTQLWRLTQLFAEDYSEEMDLLLELIDFLKQFDQIITYNGNSFDIPFINTRLKYNNIDEYIGKNYSFDIYAVIRSNKEFIHLDNLKLKTIEESIGIFREDIYSGKDCIQFYNQYVSSKEDIYKDRVLKHNYDDLFYLLDILKVLPMIQNKKTFMISNRGYNISLLIETIKEEGNYLVIRGTWKGNIKNSILNYSTNYKILIKESNIFEISIEFNKGLVTPEEICLFIDQDLFNLKNNILDKTQYIVPNNIIILKTDKKIYMDNIKNLINSLLIDYL